MTLEWQRRLVWKACATSLHYTGAVEFLRRSRPGRRVIVAYHRVLAPESGDRSFTQPGMYVTADTFDMHLRYLRSRYAVLPLEQLLSVDDGDACAITFDDGWADNYVTAFPILRRHGLPATIFLATNLVGTARWPWPDRVCFYLHRASRADFSLALESAWQRELGRTSGLSLENADGFVAAEMVIGRLKRLDHHQLSRVVAALDEHFEDLSATLHEQRPWLTWDEVREMGEHGVSFGSHTLNHVILTNVPRSEARREIVESGDTLSARSGRPVTSFCYPNGGYDAEIAGMVAEAGYSCAVTTRSGPVSPAANRFELNRMMLHEDISSSRALFACTLAGLSGLRQLWPSGGNRSA